MSEEEKTVDILNPFDSVYFPIEEWAGLLKEKAFAAREFVRPMREPFDWMINGIEGFLHSTPQLVLLLLLGLLGWQSSGWRVGLAVVCMMAIMGLMGEGAWDLGMITLAIVVSSVIVCFLIGFPLGVLAGKSDRCETALRPVLDTMQTIPAFVYLAPVVIMVGIGKVSGVLVTVVFALPPLIRLTSLGIRQVNRHVVEAMLAFGATPWQIMWKVKIPLAMPTIMAGLNQTILLSLSMVVIASMISVPGFGNEVLRAMGRLDIGKALVGGFGIVILAIVLDRVTQGLGRTARQRGSRHWYQSGPVGVLCWAWNKARRLPESMAGSDSYRDILESKLAIVLDRVTQGLGRTARQRGSRHGYQSGPVGILCWAWNKVRRLPESMAGSNSYGDILESKWSNPDNIDLELPYLYFIKVTSPTMEYRYVGKSSRPRRIKKYYRNLNKIEKGKAKSNGDPYRYVHLVLAVAIKEGWDIDFYPILNCQEQELNNMERHHIEKYECNMNGGKTWRIENFEELAATVR